jgi:hypothetical protein
MGYKQTFCQHFVSKKEIACVYTVVSFGLMRMGQVFSVSCKLVYGWVRTNCCFMSDTGCTKKRDPLLLHDLGFLTNALPHLLGASFVTCIKSDLCTVLTKQNTIKITVLSDR